MESSLNVTNTTTQQISQRPQTHRGVTRLIAEALGHCLTASDWIQNQRLFKATTQSYSRTTNLINHIDKGFL